MSNNKVVNLGNPTLSTDATSKAYVDAAIATKLNSNLLTVSGDILYHDGSLATRLPRGGIGTILQSTATGIQWAPSGLTTLANGQLFLGNTSNVATATPPSVIPVTSFGPATSTLNMNNNKVVNLGNPTLSTDATSKAYVDAADAT
jgi:hypothetical protein